MATTSKALSLYRTLLKTQLRVFGEDYEMIIQAYNVTREEFEKSRAITEPAKVQELLKNAEDAVQFLETGLHQGVLDPKTGAYTYKVNGASLVDGPPLELLNLQEEAWRRTAAGKRTFSHARSSHDPPPFS
eukprot:GGOE01036297.1.p1 GENE.GGOE01036297.1~~GGOE01036297.1.p1  ORF type:complete len:154 (+),score=47.78 GGOE01036297.1:71-463(+)